MFEAQEGKRYVVIAFVVPCRLYVRFRAILMLSPGCTLAVCSFRAKRPVWNPEEFLQGRLWGCVWISRVFGGGAMQVLPLTVSVLPFLRRPVVAAEGTTTRLRPVPCSDGERVSCGIFGPVSLYSGVTKEQISCVVRPNYTRSHLVARRVPFSGLPDGQPPILSTRNPLPCLHFSRQNWTKRTRKKRLNEVVSRWSCNYVFMHGRTRDSGIKRRFTVFRKGTPLIPLRCRHNNGRTCRQ